MEINEHIDYWLTISKRDLDSAEAILNSGRFDWALFVAHLSLEKVLKAIWVIDNRQVNPPKTHNLLKIADETKLDLSEEQRFFLLDVNSFNLEARYPDFKLDFYEKCTKEFAEEYISKIKSLHTWLLKKM